MAISYIAILKSKEFENQADARAIRGFKALTFPGDFDISSSVVVENTQARRWSIGNLVPKGQIAQKFNQSLQ